MDFLDPSYQCVLGTASLQHTDAAAVSGNCWFYYQQTKLANLTQPNPSNNAYLWIVFSSFYLGFYPQL